MANAVLLNNIDHKDLRVDLRRVRSLGDDVMFTPTFPGEFRNLQAHYPVVFAKTPSGTSFQPVALFGLREGQNLFLGPDGWDATYVPLAIERQPFLIGQANGEPMIHIDLDHPRAGVASGELLFLEHGGTTDTLERVSSVLLALHEGFQAVPAFVALLVELDLLESFVLDIELNDGSRNRLAGFYTINEDRLAQLDVAGLERLHRAGCLEAIYMAMASLSNLRALIERVNRLDVADR
ncbi:SapC family protein [Cognatilysobacter bugurensis]|uniref:Peptidase n=1 Tax=Cognatilysobacter bugurensis TaxID=543356 RepID=A0A918W8V2_9GAMM|nr:SapC family protein [Lysobacter bugurensis]GHA79145.1 peptidase [Lysobacter bugurensis]